MAFGAGVVLSAILPSRQRRSAGRRFAESFPGSRLDNARYSRGLATGTPGPRGTTKIWDALNVALAGVAGSRLSAYLDQIVPGFKREFSKACSEPSGGNPGIESEPGAPARRKSTLSGAISPRANSP